MRTIGLFFCASLAALPAAAGKLDNFESDANRPDNHGGANSSYDDDNHPFGDIFSDIFGQLFFGTLMYGGEESLARVNPSAVQQDVPDEVLRREGEALISFVRLDADIQRLDRDITARNLAAEFGYGPISLRLDQLHFRERNPRDELDLYEFELLYRMSFSPSLEIDIGGGELVLDGNERTHRGVFTMPVLYRPAENLGIEFRPAWSLNLSTYDIGLLAGVRYFDLKLGWRWTESPDESLNGPYAGISLHF